MKPALKPFAATSLPLTSSPVVFSADPDATTARIVRVWSDRSFHVAIDAAATTSDMPVSAIGGGALVHLDPGESIAAIKATGSPDGTIWLATVRRL